jgi:hypothetical protein
MDQGNKARLQLNLLAYNSGNLWRRLVLPKRIEAWWLTSLQQPLVIKPKRLSHMQFGHSRLFRLGMNCYLRYHASTFMAKWM